MNSADGWGSLAQADPAVTRSTLVITAGEGNALPGRAPP
ncbi:hypothetical protein STEPF1_01571 [Streptomyces sp. F-1]|nr:hypothetical protein STEPF1_01571 [Streptomyces sp. F-1]